MRPDFLPSPGFISNGVRLRAETTKAISYVETVGALKAGKTEQAASLTRFFQAGITALASFIELVLPTFVSAAVSLAKPRTLVIRYSEGLDVSIVPAASAFVTSPAYTVTNVAVEGPFVTLTTSANIVVGATTVTYTAPGANALRDASGNLLATHGPSAVTVA